MSESAGAPDQGAEPVPQPQPATYKDAGVNLAAWDEAFGRIKGAVRSTFGPTVLSDVGGFGGLIAAPTGTQPVLVSSIDSVGTKVNVAIGLQRHDTVGHDIVNHCVNDILCGGARPLFFLDYFGSSRLDPAVLAAVVGGIAAACRANGCALIGGETAELPGMYAPGDYDLVGCIVGVVERDAIVTGAGIVPGDVLLGLPSTGLHTNGYSLARRLLPPATWRDVHPALGRPIGDALLEPHRSYLESINRLDAAITVKGMAHITGGGLRDNLVRVLPPGTVADIWMGRWSVPPIFTVLQAAGDIALAEMCHVFNMGVGFIVVCASDEVGAAQAALPEATIIGEVHPSLDKVAPPLVRVLGEDGAVVCTSVANEP